MFKVNNTDTRKTPLAPFWCLYCELWTDFTRCSSVSIVNFEQVNASWDLFTRKMQVTGVQQFNLFGLVKLFQDLSEVAHFPIFADIFQCNF